MRARVTNRTGMPCTRRALLAVALALMPAALLPTEAHAQEMPAGASRAPQSSPALRVASWDLDAARAAEVIVEPKAVERSWRHTFGAERRSRTRIAFDTSSVAADVVLLQGVTRAADARRLFPARDWKLVVSRQILEAPATEARAAAPRTTAIAVRYRKGLRVTAQEHLPELAAPAPAEHPEGSRAAGSAGTAVRVLHQGATVWLVSVALNAHCAKPTQICPTRHKLETWLAAKTGGGDVAIAGGRGAATTVGSQSLVSCGDQAISRLLPADTPARAPPEGDVREADGCLVSVTLE